MTNQLQKPTPLKTGDKAALIAPSGPLLHPARLDFAMGYLEDRGLIPICGESCLAQHGYLAGEDDIRARDINWAFEDTDIKGIFCIRGGYGAARILDMIDYGLVRQNPKFFCGYSDVTALHTAINQKAGLMTFHTPMLCEEGFCKADAYTLGQLEKYMFDRVIGGHINNPPGHKWQFAADGQGQGQLCGGNLSVITSLMGTPYEIDTKNKIVFLEDIGEEPYEIDRMLTQMRLSGKFDTAAGIVFGGFTDCNAKNPANSLSLREIINDLTRRTKIPILQNFACGHTSSTASLPLGAVAALNSAANSFKIIQIH